MNETITIRATQRTEHGKSSAKKLRRQGGIPAVVYGHNVQNQNVVLRAADMTKMFKPGREDAEEYRLYKLLVDTDDDAQATMVMIKEIQRHPVTEEIMHIDFFAVHMDEKIVAPVHVKIIGKAAGVKMGGILRHILREITVKSFPANIPPHIDVDVSNLEIGDSIHIRDLSLPDTIQVLNDPDAAIVSVLAPTVQKEEAPAEAAEAAAAASAASETQKEGAAAKDAKS
ncbi:MAG: 50S ribosomal protein L25/general stress protein Ctc [Desulfobacterota bacterium]|nr:50S ribosomal protein L25/general stress protein Ctc [Thermodesulfobacteriota bacterium]